MKKVSIKSVSNTAVVLAALVILCVALSLASPFFAGRNNLVNIVLQATINATLACGMTFVILTGGIDLSVGSVVAFAGILLGAMLKSGVPLGAALAGCVLTGGVCGLVNGLLLTKCKLPHPFISTLGTQNIYKGIGLVITGATPIAGMPLAIKWAGSSFLSSNPAS